MIVQEDYLLISYDLLDVNYVEVAAGWQYN